MEQIADVTKLNGKEVGLLLRENMRVYVLGL